jgi:hypothetical protein
MTSMALREHLFTAGTGPAMRFRCPMVWTPGSHPDFPPAFAAAAEAFLMCAAAAGRQQGQEDHSAGILSLGDMPQVGGY